MIPVGNASRVFDLLQKGVSNSSLKSYILIEEFKLIAEISSDNLLVYSYMRQRLASFLENDLKLLG